MTRRTTRTSVVLAAVAGAALLAGQSGLSGYPVRESADDNLPSPHELLEALPQGLTAEVPGDVDRDLLAKLKTRKQLPREHLLFNILSWREFVAVCWPLDKDGKPKPNINDAGTRRYATWKTDEDTFPADGSRPAPWGTNHLNRRFAKMGIGPGTRVLDKISAVHGNLQPKLAGSKKDVIQAFRYPIWDQNGWMVRYEIYVNRDEFEYIVANTLYNLDGQIAFSEGGGKVSLPVDDSPDKPGAIELKLAWKVLDDSKGDLPDRMLTTKATILTGNDGTQPVEKTLGLVAMHIAHRTRSSPQWVWSTFMHVDSLQTDTLSRFEGKPIKPLFVNPDDPTALVNTPAQTKETFLDQQTPTQVLSLAAVPPATEQVNRVARQNLAAKKSALQYYRLLDTQWPTDPDAHPTPPGKAPDSITNKSGGKPTPVYLINPLLETYFQVGNQTAKAQEEGGNDQTQVFGTESCMGCHSSAGVATVIKLNGGDKSAVFGPQLSGDFSWLFEQRASFKK